MPKIEGGVVTMRTLQVRLETRRIERDADHLDGLIFGMFLAVVVICVMF